jgi:Zn-finger nucleic acid-binding protein
VLPKSFFGDKELEPGSRCEVEIVRVNEDDVEVKYVPHSEGEENDESDLGKGGHMEAADGLDAMAK